MLKSGFKCSRPQILKLFDPISSVAHLKLKFVLAWEQKIVLTQAVYLYRNAEKSQLLWICQNI